jgi:hypothetical protein
MARVGPLCVAVQEDEQTFRESLSFIRQTRGGNLHATHCLSVLYFYKPHFIAVAWLTILIIR